jgi:threonine dehydratase
MYESVRAGRPVLFPEDPTVANALSGGIGLENRHTFRLVRDLVDEHVLVSEAQIREAMAFAATEYRLVVEGGGAVGIAALLSGAFAEPRGDVAVVVSGGNVEPELLARIIAEVGVV